MCVYKYIYIYIYIYLYTHTHTYHCLQTGESGKGDPNKKTRSSDWKGRRKVTFRRLRGWTPLFGSPFGGRCFLLWKNQTIMFKGVVTGGHIKYWGANFHPEPELAAPFIPPITA